MNGDWSSAGRRGPLVRNLSDAGPGSIGRAAVFLDRDGTLNEAVPDIDSGMPESPLRTEDVRLLPGAGAAASSLAQAGYTLICVSNQPAAAKGKVSLPELLAVHELVLELLEREGVRLRASLLCPHHPDGVVPELSGPCECRKPAPGMLTLAAARLGLVAGESWMIGDTDSDVGAGRAAGCSTALIEYPDTAHKRSGQAAPSVLAPSLKDVAERVLELRPH